jgi:CubicO group peptidase (beta-lactamase class C family)
LKKFKFFLHIVFCLLLVSLQANSQTLDIETENYVDNLLNSNYPVNEPGISVLIAKGGNVLYKKAFGITEIKKNVPLNPDNVFAIGSMTKQFTAVAILKLFGEGKINLHDDMKKYLPHYNTHNKLITIENLLTHTSGIPNFSSAIPKNASKEDIINNIQKDELLFEPGNNFSYSNPAFYLLGLIIEKASGMTYEEYIRKNIFEPVKMTHSYFTTDANNVPELAAGSGPGEGAVATMFEWSWPFSAGNILTTTGDLLLWNEALNGDKIIPHSILQKAFTPFTLNDGTNTDYGYGWNVTSLGKYKVIEHPGSFAGFLSDAIRIPGTDLFIAALSNNGRKSPGHITQKILLKLLNISDEKPKVISLDTNSMDQYTGAYKITHVGGRLFTSTDPQMQYYFVIREGNKLILKKGTAQYDFLPYEEDKFMTDRSNSRFDFIRDADNKIFAVKVYDYPLNFGIKDNCEKSDMSLPTEKKETASERKEIILPADSMKVFEGEYQLREGFILKIFLEDGSLFVQATGQGKIKLFPESRAVFFTKETEAQLEFIPDKGGAVNRVILNQGQKYDCKRIK